MLCNLLSSVKKHSTINRLYLVVAMNHVRRAVPCIVSGGPERIVSWIWFNRFDKRPQSGVRTHKLVKRLLLKLFIP